MTKAHRTFLPAAGHHWALPFYDPLVKLMGGDRTRRELIRQAELRPGQRVLEIGCGTGGLLLEIKRLHPDVEAVGLDPDAKALERARRKAQRAGVDIQLDQGFSDELPYPDASFDRVLSSFMFHHVEGEAKPQTLREVRRVLRPGGTLELLDFAASGHGFLTRFLHFRHHLHDSSEERTLSLMGQAGLAAPQKVAEGAMLFGHSRVVYYRASAPPTA
jgi:ubiquinone/menaquinone biosynthesis C-methylase UbiE